MSLNTLVSGNPGRMGRKRVPNKPGLWEARPKTPGLADASIMPKEAVLKL